MKTIAIVIGLAALGAGGVYLYRRGKLQESTGTARPGVVGTITAGVSDVIAGITAATPTRGNPATATASSPTEASFDPRRTQTAPVHSRRSAAFFAKPVTWRDRFAQGLSTN